MDVRHRAGAGQGGRGEEPHRHPDGGGDVVRAAGALVGGGHSIDDAEPKYGLAVVGTVHPDGVWRKSGARPGDALLVAGKGHESYQEFADTVIPFDDRQVVRELIGIKTLKGGAA